MKLLDQLVEERSQISEGQQGIVTRAADEERDLTETENTNLHDLATRAEELDTRIAELRAVQVSNLEAAKLRAEVQATDDTETRAVGGVVVTNAPLTYAEENRSFGKINKTSALENAETSAVGRALAFLGLGGSEIASADEVSTAIAHGSI